MLDLIRSKEDAVEACEKLGIPEHMIDGVFRYIVHGIEPGGFLTAVLCNDFMAAAGRADSMNLERLGGWAKLVYNYFPSQSHGSPEAVNEWIAIGAAAFRATL